MDRLAPITPLYTILYFHSPHLHRLYIPLLSCKIPSVFLAKSHIGCCCCLLEPPNLSFGLRTNQPTIFFLMVSQFSFTFLVVFQSDATRTPQELSLGGHSTLHFQPGKLLGPPSLAGRDRGFRTLGGFRLVMGVPPNPHSWVVYIGKSQSVSG